MSLSKLRGNENIADVVSLEPYADIDQIRETLINVIRWLGDREPVAPGDVFLKFATWGGLVDRKVLSEKDILTNDDNPGDGDPPDEPEELYVEFMAREMTPSVTNGCTAFAATELDPTQPNLHYLEFPDGVDTSCDFTTILPAGWIGGTFQVRIYWSHGFGSVGSWDVTWEVQTNTYSSGQTLARVLVPGVVIDTTGGTADDLYITAESGPVPIPGSLNKPGNYVSIRIFRRGSTDTLGVPARLHAVRFNLGSAPVDYPPTVPDPYWDDVVLLLHGDGSSGGPIIDDSPSAHTMTVTGTAAIDTTHALFGPSSIYFDGTTGYLSAGTSSDWQLGGADFTIEFSLGYYTWSGVAFETPLIGLWSTQPGKGLSWLISVDINNRITFYFSVGGSVSFSAFSSLGTGGWDTKFTRVAVTRHGNDLRIFFDGVVVYSGSIIGSIDARPGCDLMIGGVDYAGNLYLEGYMDEIRITRGVARYTANYDVSAVAFPNG